MKESRPSYSSTTSFAGSPPGTAAQPGTPPAADEAVQLGRADILVDEAGCAQLVWTASVAPGYRLQCGTFVGLHRGVSTTLSFERPVAQASAATAAGADQGGPTEAPRTERISLRTPVSPWRTQGRARPPQALRSSRPVSGAAAAGR